MGGRKEGRKEGRKYTNLFTDFIGSVVVGADQTFSSFSCGLEAVLTSIDFSLKHATMVDFSLKHATFVDFSLKTQPLISP